MNAVQGKPPTENPRVLFAYNMRRAFIGASLGMMLGGLAGWTIDAAVSDDPYIGVRVGPFLGGMFGGVIASGAGVWGILGVTSIILCSAAGTLIGLHAGGFTGASFEGFVPGLIGSVAGAFVGLFLFVGVVARWKRPVGPPQPPPQP